MAELGFQVLCYKQGGGLTILLLVEPDPISHMDLPFEEKLGGSARAAR